ncbi:hypothetical protein D3Y55_20305 [Mesorhizobium sp. DCY119]|nr:hypothetical protein D3Y55_20305 [Mesorhizobium sp. DCY119]
MAEPCPAGYGGNQRLSCAFARHILVAMDKRYLFLAASAGCVFLSGLLLLAPNAIAVNGAQCSRVLERYDGGRRMPPRGDPEHARFVECYLLLCGIKLDI